MDKLRAESIFSGEIPLSAGGIGTLSEKRIHAALKAYYMPDAADREVPMGRYIADGVTKDGILEIQTRDFYRIKAKLSFFLSAAPVTVVYPVIVQKQIHSYFPDTGEHTIRLSPKKGSVYALFDELVGIKSLLSSQHLSFRVFCLTAKELRTMRGKKILRKELFPLKPLEETLLASPADYRKLIPSSLPALFTAKDLSQALSIPLGTAQSTLNVFKHLRLVENVGKSGRSTLCRLLPDMGEGPPLSQEALPKQGSK